MLTSIPVKKVADNVLKEAISATLYHDAPPCTMLHHAAPRCTKLEE